MALVQHKDDKYDREDEAYYSYYAMLTHQAQMLQDGVRTASYQAAILSHPQAFVGMFWRADRKNRDGRRCRKRYSVHVQSPG